MARRNSNGKSPVKLVLVLVVLIVAAVGLVVTKPWEMLGFGGGTVRFYSNTYFHLTGTADNGSLENVVVSLPDLTVGDNEILNRNYIKDGYWTINAQVDNTVVVEFQAGVMGQLVAPRTSWPVVQTAGADTSVWGPKYSIDVNLLYPGEVFQVELWWEIPTNIADKITMRDVNPWSYPTAAFIYSNPMKMINGSFFAGLYKLTPENRVEQAVEETGWTFENGESQSWVGLAPLTT